MIFKDKNGNIIYCKNNYYKEFDNGDFCFNIGQLYWLGYLVHREDGPAVTYTSIFEEWYLNGINYSEKEYLKIINLRNKNLVLDEV